MIETTGWYSDEPSLADELAEHYNWARCEGADGVYQRNLSLTDEYGWVAVTQDDIDDMLAAHSEEAAS